MTAREYVVDLETGYYCCFALREFQVRAYALCETWSSWFGLHMHGLLWHLRCESYRLGARLVRPHAGSRSDQPLEPQLVHGFEIGLFVLSGTVPAVKKFPSNREARFTEHAGRNHVA
jgi:hypothetical protein